MPHYTEDEKQAIAKKIEQYRLASLAISNNRSEGFSRPTSINDKNQYKEYSNTLIKYYEKDISDLENKNYVLNKVDLIKPKIVIPLQNKNIINKDKIDYNNLQIKTYQDEISKLNKYGYANYKVCDKDYSNNCIATATENYKKAGAINSTYQSNYDFSKNYKKYGFNKVNEPKAGDLTMIETDHMITAANNKNRYNYAPGSGEDRYEKDVSWNFGGRKHTNYTFVGTPQDSIKWRNEYIESIKNKNK